MDDAGRWTLQDAKNKFSEVVREARAGSPQHVSVRGQPAVVVLSEANYRQLSDRQAGFGLHLRHLPRGKIRFRRPKITMRSA
ncbi:MAG: type II toxin-antitoxin system Phd/YefM family antitoxin [Alphaproteobacteria bacterium]|nr:type II toxin-antitoxin system Phd/YefM family antitoxin [Alphaproteobacteria bacterium]